jgi:hypothetical protein
MDFLVDFISHSFCTRRRGVLSFTLLQIYPQGYEISVRIGDEPNWAAE